MMVKVTRKFNCLFITINELPHVFFKTEKYTGFQSWNESDSKWVITFYFDTGTEIRCEYGKKELWEAILKELGKLDGDY